MVQKATTDMEQQVEVLAAPQVSLYTYHTHLALLLTCCTYCPPNHLDLFACSLGILRHQFDVSRMSFEWLNSLQLSEYVIFIWFDLFSLFINTWAILPCSGDTKLFNDISGKVLLLQYSIQLLWVNVWHDCSGNVLCINTDPVILIWAAFTYPPHSCDV